MSLACGTSRATELTRQVLKCARVSDTMRDGIGQKGPMLVSSVQDNQVLFPGKEPDHDSDPEAL
jgi:hypothetical protein